MFRVVLDTNNFVSAQIGKKGASAKIFKLWRKNKIEILTSSFQLKELERVLRYPRIKKKYRLSKELIKKIVKIVRRQAILVCPLRVPRLIKEDPADNQILAIAEEGRADYIISGNKHLLKLKKFKRISIIKAGEFLKSKDIFQSEKEFRNGKAKKLKSLVRL